MRKISDSANIPPMKRIALLGSTGSIGQSTLKVARHLGSHHIQVLALAAHSNIDLLEEQAREFHPELIAVYDKSKALELQKRLPNQNILAGMEGVVAAATYSSANFVVSALTGTLGLIPTVAAIRAGKDVGLANKESLVSGGALVMGLVKEKKVRLLPIDSEHSAIFQCLNGEKESAIHRLILTASGGPFRNYSPDQLQQVTVEQALNHPTWSMGKKVTLDSSTLMNKGLEVIEAHWLFNLPLDKIEVVIHPQSILHSMVEFVDGSMKAQMSEPSMIVPIQYALTYPNRKPGLLNPFDFIKNGTLQFFSPDFERFRCLRLAYDAAKAGGSLPCYLNAANEVLGNRFIQKEFNWIEIGRKLETLIDRQVVNPIHSLEDVLGIDEQARKEAANV